VKLSDYVIHFLEDLGVRCVWTISGQHNMHLIDSLAKSRLIRYVCPKHEQFGAMAAEGYTRIAGHPGAMIVTTGPGGTNALTGMLGAWCDSIPCIFISGQANLQHYTDGTTIRQLGVQQINIIELVKSVTKYAAFVGEASSIRYHLEQAYSRATSGRPGPVWLDIPLNIQQEEIDPDSLPRFSPEPAPAADVAGSVAEVLKRLARAERPVFIAGSGIRLAGAQQEFLTIIERLQLPVVTSWGGADLIWDDHPLALGRFGFYGPRGGNFAVANADLLLSVGSRLDLKQVGNNGQTFARAAHKIVVDIDRWELEKGLIAIDLPIQADARRFLGELEFQSRSVSPRDRTAWLARCRDWKRRYPVIQPQDRAQTGSVHSCVFMEALGRELQGHETIVLDMGTSLISGMQALAIKRGQRVFSSTGLAAMGYGLPAAIGAWLADRTRPVICLTNDGCLQMAIQELQTVIHLKAPIKIFLFNNNGYLTIKMTQRGYMGGRFVASTPESGVTAPDFVKVAHAYGLATETIRNHDELGKKIHGVFETPGPVLCEITMAEDQPLLPRLVGHKTGEGRFVDDPIEKMWPYLPDEEFRANMIIEPLP
jgi:acetolactate synthase-1/2/3 large subunit